MGCFAWQKGKIKVPHTLQEKHASKRNQLFNNKPLVLPDPDELAGAMELSSGAPESARDEIETGDDPVGSTTNHQSSRLNHSSHIQLTMSSPSASSIPVECNSHLQAQGPWNCISNSGTLSSSGRQNDMNSQSQAGTSLVAFSGPASTTRRSAGEMSPTPHGRSHCVPFSAPLPSRPRADSSPPRVTPSFSHPTPLCCSGSSVAATEPKRIASPRADKKAVGGRPTRLPKPQQLGHPLPLPSSREDVEAGTPVPVSPGGELSPSPKKGKDGIGALNSTFRALSMGSSLMNAKPLPPPTLPTETRTTVHSFSYEALMQSFASGFCLAEGIFGSAYLARVDDGERKNVEVAVVSPAAKVLQGQREWMAEVNWLARLQNPHVCKLIGYCAEEGTGHDGENLSRNTKRLLVYEYLERGSLDKYLNSKKVKSPFNWLTKMRIALDIALGLAYLHDKAPFQIICKDLTSSCIQLDQDFRAKLSGFGLVRSGPDGDKTLASTLIGPYAAPESGVKGYVTIKSNAWSFGVILLELLLGRPHMDLTLPKEQQNLVQVTKPFLRDESKLFLMIDPELKGKYSTKAALKVANLAFNCLKMESALRPNLSEAVEILKHLQTETEATFGNLKKSRSLPQAQGLVEAQTTTGGFARSSSQAGLKLSGEIFPTRNKPLEQERHPQSSPHVASLPLSYSRGSVQATLRLPGDYTGEAKQYEREAFAQSSPQVPSLPVSYSRSIAQAGLKLSGEFLPGDLKQGEREVLAQSSPQVPSLPVSYTRSFAQSVKKLSGEFFPGEIRQREREGQSQNSPQVPSLPVSYSRAIAQSAMKPYGEIFPPGDTKLIEQDGQAQISPQVPVLPSSFAHLISQPGLKLSGEFLPCESTWQEREGQQAPAGQEREGQQAHSSPRVPILPVSYSRSLSHASVMYPNGYKPGESNHQVLEAQAQSSLNDPSCPVNYFSESANRFSVHQESSESKSQEQEFRNWPTRPIANACLSCAPILSFEPPMVREAF